MSMTHTGYSLPNFPKSLSRDTLNLIFNAAIESKEYRFARQIVLSWLSVYPGDLAANAMLAKVFISEGKLGQGIQVLEKICRIDPEDIVSQKALAFAYGESQVEQYKRTLISVYILGQRADPSVGMPGWSTILRNARKALVENDLEQAETMLFQALSLNPDHILMGITHLEIIRAKKDNAQLIKFSEIYQSRWPDAVIFKLALAEARLESGDEAAAVNLLHQCVAADAGGQVSTRWWGKNHSYKPLWPDRFETGLTVGVPASVAARLGWNQLPANAEAAAAYEQPVVAEPIEEKNHRTAHSQDKPVDANENNAQFEVKEPAVTAQKSSAWVREAEADFEKLAKRMKSPVVAKSDGRYPIYVIFSTKNGLRSQFGEQSQVVLEKEMQKLAEEIKRRHGWGSMIFYPDDVECTGKLGLATVSNPDPWKLKIALADLDAALAKKGGRIGALLIVGGPQVVPYHQLPNPTDDVDEEVLSDNPYSSLDSNYYVPEWPVGRLPGEAGSDAGLLLQQIRQSIKYHAKAVKKPKIIQGIGNFISFLNFFSLLLSSNHKGPSLGYTASVWRRSSLAAFRPVGEGKSLLVSPPTDSASLDTNKLTHIPLSYYNLHGLANTAEWYGQRDPFEIINDASEYPVALSAKDLPKNGSSPKVIFSEACYGGYINDKLEKDSIALRFLSIGTMAVVGSTCISYGSVTTPLVGADLLGFLFWTALKDGYSVGEALMQAKIGLVHEMTKRQGYLDGEDQKTLISFVLYGDPLIYNDGIQINPKRPVRLQQHINVKTISDNRSEGNNSVSVSDKILLQAKQAVEHYLPGREQLEIHTKALRMEAEEKIHRGSRFHLGKPAGQKLSSDRTVVIFQRKVQVADQTHFHYARVTVNKDGKLMKLAVSR